MLGVLAALALFLPLTGCLAGTQDPVEPQCVTRVCLADSNSHDAKRALELHKLHQITQFSSPFAEGLGGSMAAMGYLNGEAPTGEADLIGFALAFNRLIPIAVSVDYHSTVPLVDDGRVLFAQEPKVTAPDAGNWTYLALWENEATGWRRVQTGLDGEQLPVGFDWPWALFRSRYNTNETLDGVWAINLETGWKTPIGPHPINRDSPETVAWGTIVEGTAYYNVRTTSNDEYRIEERALSGSEIRVITSGPENYIDFDASGRYVSWLTNSHPARAATVYDRVTRNITIITGPDETAYNVRVGGSWVVYTVAPAAQPWVPHLEAFHVPTGTRHVLVNYSVDHRDLVVSRADTDGQRVLVTATRASPEYNDQGATDAYWMKLPEV
jgi:hypothetical protein